MNKNYLISINNISKKYDQNVVLNNYSYLFKENGLYLLFGFSGCGKTTFLNILSGATSFDKGSINIGNNIFNNKVNDNFAINHVAYITQNNHFINYLTIYDNLLLVLDKKENKEIIDKYLKQLNILDVKNKYPNQISGGEAERVSLIIAILKNYKIILLDEPTSSLDPKGCEKVLDLLNELKKDRLIICATHDEKLKNIADEIIYFPLISQKNKNINIIDLNYNKVQKRSVIPFLLKQFLYKNSEKKSTIYLLLIMILCFLVIFYCFDSHTKLNKTLIDYNDINFVNFYCNLNNEDYCANILEEYNAVDVMYSYGSNAYDIDDSNDFLKETLPYDENLFLQKDKIIYGTYFKDINDVILGIDVAKELSDNPKDLINTTIILQMPEGKVEFNIVGIIDSGNDNLYMKSLFLQYDYYVFLNSKYTEQYMYDDLIGLSEKNYNSTYLTAFFDNVDDLYRFLHDFENEKFGSKIATIPFNLNYTKYTLFIGSVQIYAKPILIVTFLIALIFFFQTEYIKNYYQRYIYAVYNYFGYKWSSIISSNIIYIVFQISTIYFSAFLISIILSKILNFIAMKYNILVYLPFLTDYYNCFILYIWMIILTTLLSFINILVIKKKGWITVISEGDDLL